jgi:hypothetical protein
MNNNHPYLSIGQEVTFVGPGKELIQAKIINVYGPDSAQLEWEEGVAIADFSEESEPGTFHFEQASPKAEEEK